MSFEGLPILCYHAIDRQGAVTSTDPSWFAATLRTLHAEGFRAIDLGRWIADGRPPVRRAFAITFDDGLATIREAADAIAAIGACATAFLVSARMGLDNAWNGQPREIPRSPILKWSDLDDLRAAGFRFGSHTRTHPRLDRLPREDVGRELVGSRDEIEDRTASPCRLLAYPYGLADANVRAIASEHFDGAFTMRLDCADGAQDAFAISRIDAFYLRTPRALGALTSGLLRPRLRTRRALRAARRLIANRVSGFA